jgi:hypothetical protein
MKVEDQIFVLNVMIFQFKDNKILLIRNKKLI